MHLCGTAALNRGSALPLRAADQGPLHCDGPGGSYSLHRKGRSQLINISHSNRPCILWSRARGLSGEDATPTFCSRRIRPQKQTLLLVNPHAVPMYNLHLDPGCKLDATATLGQQGHTSTVTKHACKKQRADFERKVVVQTTADKAFKSSLGPQTLEEKPAVSCRMAGWQ